MGTMFGVDLMTSFSGSVASIGNVGPGFGQVGSMDNFSSVPGVFPEPAAEDAPGIGGGFDTDNLDPLFEEVARYVVINQQGSTSKIQREFGVGYISAHNQEQKEHETPYNLAYFVLNVPRELLYKRIDDRIDEMLKEGLLEEVQKLKDMGYHRGMVSMQGLGYKEILAYLDGEYPLEEAVRILKRDTRHFAKRQLTWFRREKDTIWMNKDEQKSRSCSNCSSRASFWSVSPGRASRISRRAM